MVLLPHLANLLVNFAPLLQLLAPTDEAFDKLLVKLGGANGPLPLDVLLRQPTLTDILLYHIIPRRYSSSKCHWQCCSQPHLNLEVSLSVANIAILWLHMHNASIC